MFFNDIPVSQNVSLNSQLNHLYHDHSHLIVKQYILNWFYEWIATIGTMEQNLYYNKESKEVNNWIHEL